MTSLRLRTGFPATVVLALVLLSSLSAAVLLADEDEQEINDTVARVAYLSGDVSYNRGDDPDSWQPAALNFPLLRGDRVYTGRDARSELHFEGCRGYLASGTELAALDLTQDTTQVAVNLGTVSFRVNELDSGQIFEVATPNVSLTFETPGYFRVDVQESGNTRVTVWRGRATAAAGGGQVDLDAGDTITVEGLDSPRYDITRAPRTDSWDRWVESRAGHRHDSTARRYVNEYTVGMDDLDDAGRWEQSPQYGWVWSPAGVAGDWMPYRQGRWIWQDPWGWTWVSDEPWGWAPYHYGRWITWHSRWYWVPESRQARHVRYSPALVAFVGGGAGWNGHVDGRGGGFVGWFPLAPADPFYPWWGRRRHMDDHHPDAHYVHRSHVTVVDHDVFVSGNMVARHLARDVSVVTSMLLAPILHGTLPLLPTHGALRLTPPGIPLPDVMRPPSIVSTRAVVTRIAPPAPPLPFAVKLPAIRGGGGAPISADMLPRLHADNPSHLVPDVLVRPATATEPGHVTFRPRVPDVGRVTRDITVPTGHVPSTVEHPFLPVPGGGPSTDLGVTTHTQNRPTPYTQARPTPHTPGQPPVDGTTDFHRPVDRDNPPQRATPRPDHDVFTPREQPHFVRATPTPRVQPHFVRATPTPRVQEERHFAPAHTDSSRARGIGRDHATRQTAQLPLSPAADTPDRTGIRAAN